MGGGGGGARGPARGRGSGRGGTPRYSSDFQEASREPGRHQVSLCEATVCPKAETATVKPLRNTFKKWSPPWRGQRATDRARREGPGLRGHFGRGIPGDRVERGRSGAAGAATPVGSASPAAYLGQKREPSAKGQTGTPPARDPGTPSLTDGRASPALPGDHRLRARADGPLPRRRAGPATPVVESRPLSPPLGTRNPRPGSSARRPRSRATLTRGACKGPLHSRLSVSRCSALAARAPKSPRRGGSRGRAPDRPARQTCEVLPARKMAAASAGAPGRPPPRHAHPRGEPLAR